MSGGQERGSGIGDYYLGQVTRYNLPGFYISYSGDRYGIVINAVYVCCFVNDDGEFSITADTLDDQGDFCRNVDWTDTTNAKDAIAELRRMVKAAAGVS